MLIWVEGSMNPDVLKEKIMTDSEFRLRLITYLEGIISTEVPPDSTSIPDINIPSTQYDPSSIRGLNKGLDYVPTSGERQKDLHLLVERCQ